MTQPLLTSLKVVVGYLQRFIFWMLLSVLSALIGSFIFFAVFEILPDDQRYINLNRIHYYALRNNYVIDPSLVFRYIDPNMAYEAKNYKGDLYSPKFGINVPGTDFVASYSNGFRSNTSRPPFEIAIIGNSFIEYGENDLDTLSERLRVVGGLSTFNLGHAFYGPYQYIELLKRFALPLHPKYVLLCLFGGDDLENIKQYQNWLKEGTYWHFYDVSRYGFFDRYQLMLSDVFELAANYLTTFEDTESISKNQVHPDVGIIKLGGQNVPLLFMYWNSPMSVEEILSSDEGKILLDLIKEFKQITSQHSIIPIIVYIPTKLEVYGEFLSSLSGSRILSQLDNQLKVQYNTANAIADISRVADIRLINLLPYFGELAARGRLLYYPTDSHWNSNGREAAAEYIAATMGWGAKATR
jgi:hypothetical protein